MCNVQKMAHLKRPVLDDMAEPRPRGRCVPVQTTQNYPGHPLRTQNYPGHPHTEKPKKTTKIRKVASNLQIHTQRDTSIKYQVSKPPLSDLSNQPVIIRIMGVELLERVEGYIMGFTGLSPNAFFTVVAAAIAVYYILSVLLGGSSEKPRPRSFEEDVQPLPPPVQLGEITEEDLKAYDGNDSQKPLLMAIKAQIYDVSQSRMFYGPGGPYALFAGKDASRALAKMSFDEKDLNGDLTGLGAFELDALQDWEYKFMSKYVKVGSIKKPEGADPPESNTAEPSTAAAAAHVAEPTEAKEEKPETSTTTEGGKDE